LQTDVNDALWDLSVMEDLVNNNIEDIEALFDDPTASPTELREFRELYAIDNAYVQQQIEDHWIAITRQEQDLRDATLDLQGQLASLSTELDNEVIGILAQIDFLALEINSQTPRLEAIELSTAALDAQIAGLDIRALALEGNVDNLVQIHTIPPEACDTGADENTDSPWVICEVTADSAWISANNTGTYSADQICQSIGFSGIDKFGTTCGSVCGWCQGTTSTCDSHGGRVYNNKGLQEDSSTPDNRVLGSSIHWTCQ
jgi:hypothetical protein